MASSSSFSSAWSRAVYNTYEYDRALIGYYIFGVGFREGEQRYFLTSSSSYSSPSTSIEKGKGGKEKGNGYHQRARNGRGKKNEEEDGALRARVNAFSQALALRMWNEPHYRNPTYAHDLCENLSNVAIPGTGIALSVLTVHPWVAFLFLLFVQPWIVLLGALRRHGFIPTAAAADDYRLQLTQPDDWFSLWRLNSRLVAWHALVTESEDYTLENKWTFLKKGEALGVAISPFLSHPALFVKHRNMEGGMGIHFFDNVTAGGDWIIQERLPNSEFVASLLPKGAPTSTFRVITASTLGLQGKGAKKNLASTAAAAGGGGEDGGGMRKRRRSSSRSRTGRRNNNNNHNNNDDGGEEEEGGGGGRGGGIKSLSCVFRAGRAGAMTDHVAVPFDVDVKTGKIRLGRSNMHWYKTDGFVRSGLMGGTPWSDESTVRKHPDTQRVVTGKHIPDFARLRSIVEEAHLRMCPSVPIVGWDVVLTTHEVGACLLEANFSCNFFLGDFDRKSYFKFVAEYFRDLEEASSF